MYALFYLGNSITVW